MEKCVCECHNGKHIYHVRWKPCCAEPVDGGEKTPVWGCTMKDGEVRFLIAKKMEEVVPFWMEEFGLNPDEESVGVAKAPD